MTTNRISEIECWHSLSLVAVLISLPKDNPKHYTFSFYFVFSRVFSITFACVLIAIFVCCPLFPQLFSLSLGKIRLALTCSRVKRFKSQWLNQNIVYKTFVRHSVRFRYEQNKKFFFSLLFLRKLISLSCVFLRRQQNPVFVSLKLSFAKFKIIT